MNLGYRFHLKNNVGNQFINYSILCACVISIEAQIRRQILWPNKVFTGEIQLMVTLYLHDHQRLVPTMFHHSRISHILVQVAILPVFAIPVFLYMITFYMYVLVCGIAILRGIQLIGEADNHLSTFSCFSFLFQFFIQYIPFILYNFVSFL